MHVRGKEEVQRVWKGHFERSFIEKTAIETIVSSMDVKAGGKGVCVLLMISELF